MVVVGGIYSIVPPISMSMTERYIPYSEYKKKKHGISNSPRSQRCIGMVMGKSADDIILNCVVYLLSVK